ncbi:MAG: hypothetical protein IT373_06185 [Polyangiaceae bacterium]|nr:hypothetical protein [Polyangiaceae bacterium]
MSRLSFCPEARAARAPLSTLRALLGASALVCALGACGAETPTFPTAAALPSGPRQPDAVAIDLASRPPRAQARATDADGVVTLRAPLDEHEAGAVVRAFFAAVVREDGGGLATLAQPGAVVYPVHGAASGKSGRALQVYWQQRFRKLEYDRLADTTVFRAAETETYRHGALDALPVPLLQLFPAGEAFEEEDLVLRVPIATAGVKIERLIGDELYFWLRRSGERYLVHHVAEDFDL